MSGRSVNIEVVALRKVLRHAMAEGLLTNLQIAGVEWLHHEAKKRRLVSAEEVDRVCQAGIKHAPVSGQMLADFIRLMAYSGGRWMETLRLRWKEPWNWNHCPHRPEQDQFRWSTTAIGDCHVDLVLRSLRRLCHSARGATPGAPFVPAQPEQTYL